MLLYKVYGTRLGPYPGSPPDNNQLTASPDNSAARSSMSAGPEDSPQVGDGGGSTTNFVPADGSPRYYKYNVTYYTWDETGYVVVRTTGRENISSQGYDNGTTTVYNDDPPEDYTMPRTELVQEIAAVPANSPNPKLAGLGGKRVRIYHDEPTHKGDIKVVVVNVLELLPAIPANVPATGQPGTGKVTFYVRAKDQATPIDKLVEVHLVKRDNTPLTTPITDWYALTVSGYTASLQIDVALPGFYDYVVRVSDGQPPLAGTFQLDQTVAGAQYALAFSAVPHITGTPTKLGQATGTLTAHLRGGPGIADVVVSQDNVFVQTAASRVLTSTSDVVNVEVPGLAAGEYTVTATLRGDNSRYVTDEGTVDPPDLEIGDQLTFLSWVQPTLLHAANNPGTQTTAPPRLRPTLRLGTRLAIGENNPTTEEIYTSRDAEIYGPGDVLGLSQRAILGTTPAPGAAGFSALQLAAIEFKDEDLPWRYSTLQTSGPAPEPLPWCSLLVLKNTEYLRQPLAGEPLPSIKILDASVFASPDADQQKLWAHVQVNKGLGTPPPAPALPTDPPLAPDQPQIVSFLNNTLPGAPDLGYARIFCPRRLAAGTSYQAFLVPTIEASRRAGLGLEFAPNHLKEAVAHTAGQVLPVYYQWAFSTGTDDDFEDLAGRLHQANAATAAAAPPTLAVPTAAATYQLPMPALLVNAAAPAPTPAAAQAQAADELAVAQYLYTQLSPAFTGVRAANGRPFVTPPLYGRAYFATPTLQAPAAAVAASWKHQLNLDARYRALAALGAQVVQANQEEYVRRAWDQVQDLLLANEKLRGLQYGVRTTAGLRTQHLPLNSVTTTTGSAGGGNLTNAGAARAFVAEEASAGSAAKEDQAETAALETTAETAAPETTTALADYALHLTGLSLSRVRVSKATADASPALAGLSLREAIRRSSTPLAAFSPTFRRIAKPFGKYMVAEAGRPLRPTQPEPAPDAQAPGLRQRGTSLRQRDGLLSSLAAGTVAAAPARAEQVRLFQFDDGFVDTLLHRPPPAETDQNHDTYLRPSGLSGAVLANFNAAYRAFRVARPADDSGTIEVLGFQSLQRERPRLPLAEVKQDVHDGTQPGPAAVIKVKVVAPTLPEPPAPVPPGDFEPAHFDADDFYVGDFDETAPLLPGDWAAADFLARDFRVLASRAYPPADEPAPVLVADGTLSPADEPAPVVEAKSDKAMSFSRIAEISATNSVTATAATTTSGGVATTPLPVIKQGKVFPVFKDPMSEALCQLHPELFVPGLADFPADGVAVVGVNPAFIEAYMVGLNHALGSELLWRGFPLEGRGTFFQQFWNPGEITAGQAVGKEDEEALLDIKPLDHWTFNPLGSNSLSLTLGTGTTAADVPLRLALRSELLRRYPTLVLGLQPANATQDGPDDDLTKLVLPHQRLAVGADMALVTFGLTLAQAQPYYLLLLERPGQPKFGLDEELPAASVRTLPDGHTTVVDDPLSWDDFSWPYLGTAVDASITLAATGRPRASAEASPVAQLTNSAAVAYAFFQEPILAAVPVAGLLA